MSLVGNMIRYQINSPAAISNFQNFSEGDISELALGAWKDGQKEKRRKAKMKIRDRGRKMKEKKNRDC